MFANRFQTVTLAAVLSAVAPAALADGGKWQPQQGKEYFRCAATPAVQFQGTIVDAALAGPQGAC